jgi:hypothetical protein
MIPQRERYRAYVCESCGSMCWRPSRAERLPGDCSAPLPTDHKAKMVAYCSGDLVQDGMEIEGDAGFVQRLFGDRT